MHLTISLYNINIGLVGSWTSWKCYVGGLSSSCAAIGQMFTHPQDKGVRVEGMMGVGTADR